MKKVLFVISALNTGGAEKSLVNLLNLFDYSKYEVDLLLFKKEGVFIKQVPKEVNILDIPKTLKYLFTPLDIEGIKDISSINAGIRRYIGTFYTKLKYKNNLSEGKQVRWNKFYKSVIDNLSREYDVAISYMHGEAMYYVADKVKAKKKVTWVHNDYRATRLNKELDSPYYDKFDKIVSISEECINIFSDIFPELSSKTVCIPNLTSSSLIRKMAIDFMPNEYINIKSNDKYTKILLSIGRLSSQKGFDIAINAAKILKDKNINFIWYIMGQGELEKALNKQKKEVKLDDRIVFMGIRENPYPYIKNCDILVQTSRFEGKSVVLDETKILSKPIISTNYNTVKDQIIDGEEGIIVDLSAECIAEGIIDLINDDYKKDYLVSNLEKNEYGNENLINKYYELIN